MNSENSSSVQAQFMNKTPGNSFNIVESLASELSSKELDLPAFPDIAVQILDALNDPALSADMMTRIVRSDPVLTAQLMRLTNSAMLMRGSQEVTDLKTAINRIGFQMVRNAAISRAMDTTFSVPESSPLRVHIVNFRKHSIRVASLAYLLAKRKPCSENPDEAMLAGLLHNIGKFYILAHAVRFPDQFSDDQELEAHLKTWHTGIGRAIVESWGFLEQIVEAVDQHEDMDRSLLGPSDLTDIVIVGNLIANDPDLLDSAWSESAGNPSCQKLQIDKQAVKQLLRASAKEINSLSRALSG